MRGPDLARRILLAALVVAPALLAGCGGEQAGSGQCDDRLEIRLFVASPGAYTLDGTADGQPFHCSLWLQIDGYGENPEDFHFGGTCSGPARLGPGQLLIIEGTPTSIPWSATWIAQWDPTARGTRSGQLDPTYDEAGGCRTGEASVSL